MRVLPRLTAAVIALALWPASADAKPRPDLVVMRASAAPAGSTALLVDLRVRNRGQARAAASRVTVSVGVPLSPVLRVPRVKAGRSVRVRGLLALPLLSLGGRFTATVCADSSRAVRERREGNNCLATAPFGLPFTPAAPLPTPLPPPVELAEPRPTPTASATPSPSPTPTPTATPTPTPSPSPTATPTPTPSPSPSPTPTPTATPTPTPTAEPVDTPETTLVTAPSGARKRTLFAFAATSDEAGSTFVCRIDGGDPESCPGSFERAFEPGDHTLAIAAVDPEGHEDPTPATAAWEALDPSPELTLSGPGAVDRNQAATFGALPRIAEDRELVSVRWDLDEDGQFDDGTGVSAEHTFRVSGSATVKAAVQDSEDELLTVSLAVEVGYPGAALPPIDEATTVRQNPAHDGFHPLPVSTPLEHAWTAPVVGPNPIVADGRVFVRGYVDHPGMVRLAAIDAATGNELWARPSAGGGTMAYGSGTLVAQHGNAIVAIDAASGLRKWAASHPESHRQAFTIDGDTVFAAGPHALDLETGRTRWRHDLITGAPALDVADAFATGGCTRAVDRRTGVTQWQSDYCSGAFDSPTVMLHGGLAFIPRTPDPGEVRTTFRGTLVRTFPRGTPAASGGTVVWSRQGGLHAEDAVTGAPKWSYTPDLGTITAPLIAGTTVIAATAEGSIHAVDLVTGESVWTGKLPDGATPHGPPTAGAGLILFGSSKGLIAMRSPGATPAAPVAPAPAPEPLALPPAAAASVPTYRQDAARSGWAPGLPAAPNGLRERWRAPAAGQLSHAVSGGGRVHFVRTGLRDVAVRTVDAATGELLWEVALPPGDHAGGSLGLVGGHLIAGRNDFGVVSLDPATGEEQWRVPLEWSPSGMVPLPAGDRVLIHAGFAVLAIDVATGETAWNTSTKGYDSPLASDGTRSFGQSTYGAGSTAFSLDAGATVWQRSCGEVFVEGPTVHAGLVFFRSPFFGVMTCDAETGQLVDGFVGGLPPAAAGNLMVHVSGSHPEGLVLNATDPATGRLRWQRAIGGTDDLAYPPLITPAGIAVARGDSMRIDLHSPVDGSRVGRHPLYDEFEFEFGEASEWVISDVSAGDGMLFVPVSGALIAIEPAP